MLNKKTLSLTLAVIVVALALIMLSMIVWNKNIETTKEITEHKTETIQPIQEPLPDEWKVHKNDKFGIEFKYPEKIQLDNGNENSNGWYSVDGNYDYLGDNYFSFSVLDKIEGVKNIKSLEYREKNLFAPNELTFQNGKFIQTDGYGTENYYFVDNYYEGENYVYHFMMSRPDYSEELFELFENILASAKLTK